MLTNSRRARLVEAAAGLLTASGLLIGPTATVASAAPPQASAIALGRFEEGKRAFDAGKFEEALIAFQASQALLPSPNSRLYIGRCYRALGKAASAYTNLRLASREAQDRLTASGERRYGATRDAAASEAAELEPKVPRLTVAVPSDVPDGFVVHLDGEEIPRAAWGAATETDPGEHEVAAAGPRLVPSTKKISLALGQQLRLDIPVQRLPTASIELRFASMPSGLAIELDGRPLDVGAASRKRESDIGPHRVVVHAPGYKDFVWQKALADREAVAVDVRLEPDLAAVRAKGPPKWVFFGVGGLAVASVAIGTVFAVQASSMASDETAKDPLMRDPATRDDVKATATRANVFFIAGGALAVGAGALFFLTDWKGPRGSESRTAVAPVLGPGTGGLAARGSF